MNKILFTPMIIEHQTNAVPVEKNEQKCKEIHAIQQVTSIYSAEIKPEPVEENYWLGLYYDLPGHFNGVLRNIISCLREINALVLPDKRLMRVYLRVAKTNKANWLIRLNLVFEPFGRRANPVAGTEVDDDGYDDDGLTSKASEYRKILENFVINTEDKGYSQAERMEIAIAVLQRLREISKDFFSRYFV